MVVLEGEQTVFEEIGLHGHGDTRATEADDSPDLEPLGAHASDGQGTDLKKISRRAAKLAEKRVIERVLRETRRNRKEAAERLRISSKALLYKMKEYGL